MIEIASKMSMFRKFGLGILALSCLLFFGGGKALAQKLEVGAYVNSTTIGLNQQFELTVQLSGSGANGAPQPPAPDLDTFASYVGTSTSTSMQFINGKSSVTRSFTHHFIATKAGKFRIPAIIFSYAGKNYATKPIDISIVKGQARAQRRQPSRGTDGVDSAEDLTDLLFLKATVSKRRVYQNEPVVVSYKIYTALNVTNYGISQLPNSVGFWSEEFELPGRPRLNNEVVNGKQYRVAEIKKLALFPQGPGEKRIDPLAIECEVQMPRQRRRRDIFDSFFDDPFFGLNRTVRKVIHSNAIKIDVQPLPQKGKPIDFSGAVGAFFISGTVDRNHVKANEAITLRIKIAGTGNIKIIPEPKIDFPGDFEVYDPEVTESISRKGGQISGSKSFEFVLIPRFPGNQTIKPVRFSYFDPTSQRYRTIATEAFDIFVEKGEEQFVRAGFGNSKEDVKFIGQDIRFIRLRIPEFQPIGKIFYKSSVFYAMLVLPLLALTGTVAYRRHLDKLSSNVAYARSRKANQMVLKRLKKARAELNTGDQKRFYAEVANAMMGFLGDKFNVAAAGLITDQVEEMLRERGIEEQTVSGFLECLQTCDFQRFAPSESNNGEMKEFFEKARKAIVSLDKKI